MKISCEISLGHFGFWAGAVDNAARFTYEELEELESMLEDMFYGEEVSETMVNDMMWFEPEMLCEWLGIEFEEWLERDLDK